MEKETKHTPEDKGKWIFVEHGSLIDKLQTELSEMKKENARLKSELLHRDVTVLPQKDLEYEEMKASLQSKIDRLKQENEKLKKDNKVIYGSEMVQLSDYQDLKKEREELRQAVEKLHIGLVARGNYDGSVTCKMVEELKTKYKF